LLNAIANTKHTIFKQTKVYCLLVFFKIYLKPAGSFPIYTAEEKILSGMRDKLHPEQHPS
jgi:hypothetical protein